MQSLVTSKYGEIYVDECYNKFFTKSDKASLSIREKYSFSITGDVLEEGSQRFLFQKN